LDSHPTSVADPTRIQQLLPTWVTHEQEQEPPAPAKLKGDAPGGLRSEGKNGKMRLNEFLMKYVGSLQRGDLEFKSVPAPGAQWGTQLFVSTLIFNNLHGRLGEGMCFTGEPKSTKQDAEHSASDAALEYFTSLTGTPVAAASETSSTSLVPVSTTTSSKPTEKISNPKGTLQEIVAKKLRRQTQDDLCYHVSPAQNGFIVQLRLGAGVMGGEAMVFESSLMSGKTKKSIKDAEEEVATTALLHLKYGSSEAPAPMKALMNEPQAPTDASTKEPSRPREAPEELKEDVEKCQSPEEKPDATVKVCLVRPDGKEKCMLLLKNMSISELIQKYRPSSLEEDDIEVVGPGDMVLLPEFTLLDCTMVFDTEEDVPRFVFRKAED